jgi:hypothetical protein
MLRHIVSVSLAMTVCATLIPTKVNAATLTIRPSGDEIPARPGDSIDFTFALSPARDSLVTFTAWSSFFDSSELSSVLGIRLLVPLGSPISFPQLIARGTFTVLTPVKDGIRDVGATVSYNESGRFGDFPGLSITRLGGDVVPVSEPVPEPLTIFGTATALGCGVLFKRKSSKKTVS